MTQRERVRLAAQHKSADIIPHQLDVTDGANQKLLQYYGDPDYFYTKLNNSIAREKNKEHKYDISGGYHDLWGAEWRQDGGTMGVPVGQVLKEPSLEGYTFPVPNEVRIRSQIEGMMEKHPDRFLIYEPCHTLFETAWDLRGMEDILCDFLTEEDFVEELLDKIMEYQMQVTNIALQYPIDCIMFGDDWGQQRGLLMGKPLWKKYIYPRMKKLFQKVKDAGKFVCLHSCGDCREILGDMVDMGLDIYNTFQPEIYDVEAFAKEWGDKLTIYGGISTQNVLSFGTPQQVKDEMHRMLDLLGPHGYILASTHQITPDTPIDNVIAFMEVVENQ